MATAAHEDSVELIADSGWRSLSFQRQIIRKRMAAGDSFEEVLNSVAPPGYSEHHTGRALDLCPSEARFAFTETYRWLSEHGAEFGFHETLPKNPRAPLTWESWHWTYVPKASSSSVK
jgi:D-alanyl-D-alanine carboxypeptidase